MCSADGFHDERDGVDVAAQLLRWEVQPNEHVLEKGFADSSGFIFECEGIDGFLKPFPTKSSDRARQQPTLGERYETSVRTHLCQPHHLT